MSYKAEHRGVWCEFTLCEDGSYALYMTKRIGSLLHGVTLMHPACVIERAKYSQWPIHRFLLDVRAMLPSKHVSSDERSFLETAVSVMENEMAYAIPTREPE